MTSRVSVVQARRRIPSYEAASSWENAGELSGLPRKTGRYRDVTFAAMSRNVGRVVFNPEDTSPRD